MLIAVLGRRLMGKTTLAVHQVDKWPRRCVLDPRGLIRRPGAIVARSVDGLKRGMLALADGETDEVVYTPTIDHKDAFDAFAGEMRTWVIEHPRRAIAFLIDEVSFYESIGPRQVPNRAFMFAMKSCDPEKVAIVLTCHRPADLSPDVRALLDKWCLFRTTQEHDLAVIRERCTADVVDQVQALDDHHFVTWDDGDSTSRAHRAPWTWHSDLSPRGAETHILELR